ncbi:MAG: hypothetical protein M3Z97_11415, partial [Candidatus Dormibacteraeota bacterium]|nr:hypothetical protein [Candidatus Dormibacteraeota bacterium]
MKLSIGSSRPELTIKPRRLVAAALTLGCSLLVLLSSSTVALAAPTPASPARSGPAAASSDWPTFLHDPARTAANPGETTLSTANASKLTPL